MAELKSSRFSSWILACRMKTLPAAIVPVVLGTALAWRENRVDWVAALICLMFALLVQVGTNFANDYYDFIKGADTPNRVGPTRAVAAGLIAPATMFRAMCGVFAFAFASGLILIVYGGPILLVVGVLSIVCAVAYTGGPYPLAYNGLGDVFVVLFFGLIAVAFTFFVQAGYFSGQSFIVGFGCGVLINNILVVNNYRDYYQDRQAGKRTLVVRLGRPVARLQYFLSSLAACLLVPGILWLTGFQPWILLPVLMIPIGIRFTRKMLPTASGNELNQLLAQSAKCVVVYGSLMALGIALS